MSNCYQKFYVKLYLCSFSLSNNLAEFHQDLITCLKDQVNIKCGLLGVFSVDATLQVSNIRLYEFLEYCRPLLHGDMVCGVGNSSSQDTGSAKVLINAGIILFLIFSLLSVTTLFFFEAIATIYFCYVTELHHICSLGKYNQLCSYNSSACFSIV